SCGTTTGFIDPVHEYGRGEGTSITGGYVYRGSALSALVGKYVFADFGSGRIWRLDEDGAGGYTATELLDGPSNEIASFGQGNDGELYVTFLQQGTLHKIVDGGGAAPANPMPDLLSETGCVNAQEPSAPASGLIPYSVA